MPRLTIAALLAAAAAPMVGAVVLARMRRRSAEMAREANVRAEVDRVIQLKDDLLASVSHELRTPLNAIVGWTHILKAPALSAEDREHALEAIERNARVETRLVADLLDEASLSRGHVLLSVHPRDLRKIVRRATRAVATAADARDLHVNLVFGHGDVDVEADEDRLEQAIWCLVWNAVRCSPRGGTIRVDTARAGTDVLVRVRDSGEGIDREFLPHVFDAFRQAPSTMKRPGLGLGLSLVKHIVELHGGAVRAASAGRGAGATFSISVPVARRVSAGG